MFGFGKNKKLEDARAEFNLAKKYSCGGIDIKKDEKKAIELFLSAAKKGHADAQAELGRIYVEGLGVEADEDEALKWYFKAATGGNQFGQAVKGGALELMQEYKEAAKCYRLSAEQGNANSAFDLGRLYRDGKGVMQDPKEAIRWFQLAAIQGHAKAPYNLGGMYEKGEGVTQDYAQAVKFYRLAEEQGYPEAQT
ncbi:MAG: tetratricopeptide repeat protein, partial [Methylococcaceae bacterium]